MAPQLCERCHQLGGEPRHLLIALDGAAPAMAGFILCRTCADIGAAQEPIDSVSNFLTGTLLAAASDPDERPEELTPAQQEEMLRAESTAAFFAKVKKASR